MYSDIIHDTLETCYGCRRELRSGDMVFSYHEHYICVPCTPTFIAETKRPIILSKK